MTHFLTNKDKDTMHDKVMFHLKDFLVNLKISHYYIAAVVTSTFLFPWHLFDPKQAFRTTLQKMHVSLHFFFINNSRVDFSHGWNCVVIL